MDDATKWANATQKLIELTERGDLQWVPQRGEDAPRALDIVGDVYVATADGREIAVFKQEKHLDSRDLQRTRSWPFYNVIIQFTEGEWVWPVPMDLRMALLDAIQNQVANPHAFLERFLTETSSH